MTFDRFTGRSRSVPDCARLAFLLPALALASCEGGGEPLPELGVTPVARFAIADAFGFEGSPTLCDLDHDGRMELVAPVASASLPGDLRVVDAIDGTLRFRNRDNHAAYSYPHCVDVNADGTDDVLVAGRGSDVWAISGVDGATLFRLGEQNPGAFPDFMGEVGSVVTDRVSAGTLFVALRGSRSTGVAGAVVAFDATGNVRARWDEPEAKEIYASPAVVRVDEDTVRVVIGSGGELHGGSLRVLEYDETNEVFTLLASVASACDSGGYIASPMLADLDGDGTLEILAADFCGRGIIASFAGEIRASVTVPGTYATANPVTLHRGDGDDAIFTFASVNPSRAETVDVEQSYVVRIDATGREVFRTRIATQALATPSTLELTGDGVADVLVTGMDFRSMNESGPAPVTAGTFVIDGASGLVRAHLPYGNAASTPIIADVDSDGLPDVFLFDTLLDQNEPRSLMRIELEGAGYDAATTVTGFRGFPFHDGVR